MTAESPATGQLEARLAVLTTLQEGDARERLRKVVARGAFEDFSDYPLDGENALVERVIDALLAAFPVLSRTTSPDAATERVTENSVRHVKQLTTKLQNKRESLNDQRREFRKLLAKARAERDAALAAVERIRQAVSGHPKCDRYEEGDVISCGWKSAYASVVAALDGAPEPDREAQLERVAARLREIVYLCGDDLGCQCEEAQNASADLARELSIIAAERPTLTADEVWAIAKAEHDYANDSDNVGAFVMPLVDGLRAAGVPFDEQPFIDSGYLLPVEGEKP